jgi:pSer/pThr/pTyr-binding forkhead associated (FHA) protein
MPAFDAVTWSAVVGTDREYYDRMHRTRKLTGPAATFPSASNERRFALEGRQMRIGRHSAARGVEPEIDLAGPEADPGVSRLHAVLISGPEGSWSLQDTGSANGTLLNGHEITVGDTIPLRDGDRINLGAWTVITVHHG